MTTQTEYVQKAIETDDIDLLLAHMTVRQRRFAEEYVIDFNGKAAAIRAGYATKNAEKQAHILVKHPAISYYIDHLTKSAAAKAMSVDPDYVLQRVTAIINKEGAKDSDKLRGLELLARHLGMLTDKQEITGKDGGAIEINRRIEEDNAAVIARLRQMKKPDLKVVGED